MMRTVGTEIVGTGGDRGSEYPPLGAEARHDLCASPAVCQNAEGFA
jgi:hypothetical protein